MLDASLIQQLKRTNISKDAEKTKQRFGELWKAASASDKETIENLTGVARSSIQRIYKEGSISAKIVVAASQVMNASPYYLTGVADEPGESTESGLLEFLRKFGYGDLLTAYSNEHKAQKTRKKKEAKTESAPVPEKDALADNNAFDIGAVDASDERDQPKPMESLVVEMIIPVSEAASNEMAITTFFDDFSEDDIMLLVRSVKIRANAGVADAIRQAGELKKILLS